MKINKLSILTSLICLMTLPSCQSVKEGLSGEKNKSGDEFLVQKKNPLVKPKNFDELPKPSQKKNSKSIKVDDKDNIEDIFKIDTQESDAKNSTLNSLEKSILKKINKD
jgi:hypothetical protein